MCRYATTCSHSYISHMMGFHAGNASVRKEISPKERKMAEIMYCLCGYSSQYGNSIGETNLYGVFFLKNKVNVVAKCR